MTDRPRDMNDSKKIETLGMALGCAVKVIASTCVQVGDEQLARDVIQMLKDEKFDDLAQTFEVMSAGLLLPPDTKQ